MAENSKIEWCHHTFNPWIGCTKVGPGCDNCYAEADFDKRKHVVKWGAGQPRKRTVPSTWAMPLKWNAEAERLGVRYRVFCASLADVFDNEVDREWRDDLATLILNTPHLYWLLTTKRIGNAGRMLGEMFMDGTPDNVWLGVTITSQTEADRDIPKLLAVPAAVRFLSMEPLLGPVDIQSAINLMPWQIGGGDAGLHWVIVGGESGPNARPMHPDWARSLRDQCAAAGVPFLFKQWGEWVSADCIDLATQSRVWRDSSYIEMESQGLIRRYTAKPPGPPHFACDHWLKAGKKAAGRLLDGVQHDGYPSPTCGD